ncbi:hypothetical protein DL771_004954 [Monosporascus sp. 5C6A]|nr:hypothetical protein DL771_004954 [Monosporascus sp. 5C6A]
MVRLGVGGGDRETIADTVLMVAMNIVSTTSSNLIDPNDPVELSPENIKTREFGSKMVLLVEQMQCVITWSVKACLLIMYGRLTSMQNIALKAVAAYVALSFVVMEVLYLGILSAILSKYYSFTEPFGAAWMFWYIRESSTAIITANLPLTYALLQAALRRCGLGSKLSNMRKSERSSRYRSGYGGTRLSSMPRAHEPAGFDASDSLELITKAHGLVPPLQIYQRHESKRPNTGDIRAKHSHISRICIAPKAPEHRFGFSVGDFLAALKLVGTVIDALRESSNSGSTYRELLSELYSLETALLRVKRIDLDESQHIEKLALRQAAAQCQRTIDSFWKKNFRAEIAAHTGSIEVLLLTVQMDMTTIHARGEQRQYETLTGRIQELSNHGMSKLAAIAGGIAEDVQQGRSLLESSAKVLETNLLVFRMVHDIQQFIMHIPTQVQRQQPVYMVDAFNKESPFHLEFVRSAEAFISVLKVNFKASGCGPGMIDRGEFLIEESGTQNAIDITKAWETCFYPGQRVTMNKEVVCGLHLLVVAIVATEQPQYICVVAAQMVLEFYILPAATYFTNQLTDYALITCVYFDNDDVAGGDGVDGNAARGPAVGEALGELADGALTGSVGGTKTEFGFTCITASKSAVGNAPGACRCWIPAQFTSARTTWPSLGVSASTSEGDDRSAV